MAEKLAQFDLQETPRSQCDAVSRPFVSMILQELRELSANALQMRDEVPAFE